MKKVWSKKKKERKDGVKKKSKINMNNRDLRLITHLDVKKN